MKRTFSGPRLRDARLAAGLTPELLAVATGRSVHSIHSYEIGRVNPPLPILSRLALAVGVDISDLFAEEVVHV